MSSSYTGGNNPTNSVSTTSYSLTKARVTYNGTDLLNVYVSGSDTYTATFTKNSSQRYLYIYFTNTYGSEYSYIRFDMNDLSNGTYRIKFTVNGNSTPLKDIMLTSGSTEYSWADLTYPIAYTGDFAYTSSDTGCSVFLYSSGVNGGVCNYSSPGSSKQHALAPLWSSLSIDYAANQAVRYSDINYINTSAY